MPVSRQVISAAPAAPVVPSLGQPDVLITPDGETIVYQSSANPYEVADRPVDGLESVTLQGPEQILAAFVSPGGTQLGFLGGAGGPIQRVSIFGGPAQTVAQPLANLRGASWGADDVIVYGVRDGGGLWQVPAGGGEEPRPLTETDGGIHWFPHHLPNGAGIPFASTTEPSPRPEQISVLDLRTGGIASSSR